MIALHRPLCLSPSLMFVKKSAQDGSSWSLDQMLTEWIVKVDMVHTRRTHFDTFNGKKKRQKMNHLMIGIFKPYGQTCWRMPHKINKHLCGVVKGRWPSETFLHITDSFKILTMLSCCSREIQTVDWFSTGVNQCSQATTVPKTPFRRAALLCDGDRTDCLLCVFSACVLLQTLSLQGLFLSSLCLWVCYLCRLWSCLFF